jgi:dsRNA-specific ribonuclease
MASGEGSTKKEAEQRAARMALERLEVAAKG